MLALSYLYHMLATFRPLFSRHTPWLLFWVIILGFIGTPHLEGLTSLCRFWFMQEADYHRLLHFFHSSAWCLDDLVRHWSHLVWSQQVAVTVEGRAVLLGDHTAVVKDARRMPGVVTLYQDSETQSKPTYYRGHYWGVVGLLVGSLREAFCLPLEARLHQGFAHLGAAKSTPTDRDTQGVMLVQMALDFALRHDRLSIVVLDAFFSIGAVFELANSVWSMALKQPYLTILTRAKKSYVAYLDPLVPTPKPRGRPKKYGDKIKLKTVFETPQEQFLQAECQVYGHVERISYLALNLLWKPRKGPVRFIFAITSRGPLILMCSDLTMAPLLAIELYCARVRVETMFSMLKSVLGAFAYRFWSKYVPRHSRKPKKNAALKPPPLQHLAEVYQTWQACEGFVMLGCIALGLLQLIALKFPGPIWAAFTRFLRTRSRALPSERTVKEVLAQELTLDFHNPKPSAMMQAIHRLGQSPDDDDAQRDRLPRTEPQVPSA
jgi:DDE superfamily endonuclease